MYSSTTCCKAAAVEPHPDLVPGLLDADAQNPVLDRQQFRTGAVGTQLRTRPFNGLRDTLLDVRWVQPVKKKQAARKLVVRQGRQNVTAAFRLTLKPLPGCVSVLHRAIPSPTVRVSVHRREPQDRRWPLSFGPDPRCSRSIAEDWLSTFVCPLEFKRVQPIQRSTPNIGTW